MKWIFALIFIVGSICNLLAQDEVQVFGRLVDAENSSPIEFATISFLQASDSNFVEGDITDVEGNFSVELIPGRYIVRAQFLGYSTTEKEIQFANNSKKKNIGEIRISQDASQLNEVVVRGERTQMEMTLDKRVYNIGQDLVNRGGDASQILDNLPSVSVDMDGNVSLRGSSSVKVLINGKPSGLVGLGSTEALRQLDANMIERVEIITNPSARYEAEGMAGIINIILRKERRSGLNGVFNVETGIPDDHGASFNLNYRRNWFNLFGNYSFSYRNTPRSGTTFQRFSDYITDIERDMSRSGFSNSIRLGGDIYINENNIITASGIYRISKEDNTSEIRYLDKTLNRLLMSQTNRLNEEDEDESVWEYSMNYTRNFGAPNHKFTFDFQYEQNEEVEDANIREMKMSTDELANPLFQRYLNEEFESDYLVQADYVKPFGEDSKFETGWRSTFRTIDNSYLVEEQEEAGDWFTLPQFTNDFSYEENIHSLYLLYGSKLKAFSFQGGIRAEYSHINTLLEQTNEKNNNEYLNVFPSVHLTYSMNDKNSIQLSYGKRFNRPGFRSLNPFYTYSDSRNIRTGNPNLKPEFTDSYELGYLKNWQEGSMYLGAYYRHTTDEFEGIETRVDSILYSFPINLSVENAFGFEGNFSKEFFDRLNIDGNINFYRSISEGNWQGLELNSETVTMSGRLNVQMEMFNEYNFQVSSYYRAPRTTTQGKRKSMYSLDFGVSKDLFNEKGTVVLNIRNVLNTLKYRSETFGEGFYSNSEYKWRPRQISLSFVYRLNRSKDQSQRRDSNGNGDGEDINGDF